MVADPQSTYTLASICKVFRLRGRTATDRGSLAKFIAKISTIRASSAGDFRKNLAKTSQIRTFPLQPLRNVDLKRPSHPESLQVLSALLWGEGRRQ